MVEIRTVLLTTDFSEAARAADRYAAYLAKASGARLVVAHVIDEGIAATVPMFAGFTLPEGIDLARFREETRKASEAALETVAQGLRREGIPVETRLRTGRPFLEIVALARELPADLIVMGTHGRAGIGHALLGSVTDRVVRKAPCPVLTVKAEVAAGEGP